MASRVYSVSGRQVVRVLVFFHMLIQRKENNKMACLKRCLIIIALLFSFLPINAYAEASLEVTGYIWRNLPDSRRTEIMEEYFDFYKLNRNKYSIAKGVKTLDIYYDSAYASVKDNDTMRQKADAYFEDPTLLVFGSIVSERTRDWGIKQLEV